MMPNTLFLFLAFKIVQFFEGDKPLTFFESSFYKRDD